MNQQNRQPDLHDEQAVIAAVQLLVRTMKPAQKEKLLSTLLQEQEQGAPTHDGHPEPHLREHADDAGRESNTYPIQPLLLASDESQHSSSESTAQTPPTSSTDSPRESFYEEAASERPHDERRSLETHASFFLPATSSLARGQWWTRLALGALFLFMLSLSTLVAYRVGVHAAQSPNVACQRMTYIMMNGRFMPFADAVSMGGDENLPLQQHFDGHTYYIVGSGSTLYWVRGPELSSIRDAASNCQVDPPIKIFSHHHDNDDD